MFSRSPTQFPFFPGRDLVDVKQYGSEGFVYLQERNFVAPDPLMAISPGPSEEGRSDANNFSTAWFFRKDPGTGSFFYGIQGGAEYSADAYFSTGTAADKLSLCFESTGRPVFAVGAGNTFTLKRSTGVSVESYGPFAGVGPQLFYNGLLLDHMLNSGDRDAVCYYLNEGNLLARFQRDNFGIAYTILEDVKATMIASSATEGLVAKLALAPNLQSFGYRLFRGAELRSFPYAPTFRTYEVASVHSAMVSGEHRKLVVLSEADETTSVRAGFTGIGFYTDGVITTPIQLDATSVAAAFHEGLYLASVVFGDAEDTALLQAAFYDGSYDQLVVVADTREDAAFLVAGFLEGLHNAEIAPDAPTALDATTVASNGFTANWTAVSGAETYALDVSESSDFSTFVAGYEDLALGDVTEHEVTGLDAETTYYFRVRASNTAGASAGSNVVGVVTEVIELDADLVAKLGIWLDAEEGVEVSTGVSASDTDTVAMWLGKTPDTRNASQGNSDYRPTFRTTQINGRPVVRFERVAGQEKHMDVGGAFNMLASIDGATILVAGTNFTVNDGPHVLISFSYSSGGGNQALIQNEVGRVVGELQAGGRRQTTDGFQYQSGGSLAATDPTIHGSVFRWVDGELDLYQDGVLAVSGAFQTAGQSTSTNLSLIRLGSDGNDANLGIRALSGDLAEVLVFPEALTTDELNRANSYLMSKYGI